MNSRGEQVAESSLVDVTDLPEMWETVHGDNYNIVGALNICQGKFDNCTLWQRIPEDGTYKPRSLPTVDCVPLRATAISNATANNKSYTDYADYENERAIAYTALYDYNATKYPRETLQGTARQAAAKRGAASRKANKEKNREEIITGVVKELLHLKEWQGLRDEEWKGRFDCIISNVLNVTGVKMTPGPIRTGQVFLDEK